MSSKDDALPFPRGSYSGSGEFVHLEGREYIVNDDSPQAGVTAQRTGRSVRVRLVRNVAGFNILPKRLVSFKAQAGKYGSYVDGYADVTAEHCYPVDEYVSAAGVPDQSLFYITVEGPATVLTDLAGGANNVITVGMLLVSLTAVTSGATTAGRVAPYNVQADTTTNIANAAQIVNRIGRALTAKTTANTNADVLVDIGKW